MALAFLCCLLVCFPHHQLHNWRALPAGASSLATVPGLSIFRHGHGHGMHSSRSCSWRAIFSVNGHIGAWVCVSNDGDVRGVFAAAGGAWRIIVTI